MSFVLDTNVVSEPRKRFRADAGVMRWFDSVETEDLYISVLVLGEIRQGVEGLRRRDPIQAGHLESWLAELRRGYADRILPIDLEAAEEWGRMNVPDPISTRDGLMAATAKVMFLTFAVAATRPTSRAPAHACSTRSIPPFMGATGSWSSIITWIWFETGVGRSVAANMPAR